MAATSALFVGLMSGTSLDGIDAALVDFSDGVRLIAAATYPLPTELHAQLLALCQPGDNEIERMGRADRALGLELAGAVNQLLAKAQVDPQSVRAIGSHGQTIRHRPPSQTIGEPYPFTLQIGDPTTVAHHTGITTVADFRRRDIAAGGEGAPLVPAFHQAVFSGGEARAIVNIGGIANVTGLHSDSPVTGFDTGPGNTLLDAWIQRHQQQPFDRDGAWAASGQALPTLLEQLLQDAYFAAPPPKSTGREHFNLSWLDRHLHSHPGATAQDIQATLVELTARSICQGIAALPFTVEQVFVCGGGAYNHHLMRRLQSLLQPTQLASTQSLGIAPAWVEAAAFAWLAQRTLSGKPGNEPAVTGAEKYCTLGAIYPA